MPHQINASCKAVIIAHSRQSGKPGVLLALDSDSRVAPDDIVNYDALAIIANTEGTIAMITETKRGATLKTQPGMNLDKYRLPLSPAPARIKALVANGVQAGPLTDARDAPHLLNTPHAPQEGVWRDEEGKVLVICNTDFPDATPAMIDWWFGWHLPCTERYRLWHPTAHIAARVKEDRSALADHRARYIGNESWVDEYIGKQLKHLAIRFVPPAMAGFTTLEPQGATAICAVTSDRWLHAEGGRLCHLVLPRGSGCQMRSGFWLGNIRHDMNALHFLLNRLYNSKALRQRIVSDRFGLDLLQHCAEEMAHLAKFLPSLYADMALP